MFINVLDWDKETQIMLDDEFGFEHHSYLYEVPTHKVDKFCEFCREWDIQIDYCNICGNTGILEVYEHSRNSHYGLQLVIESCPHCNNGGNGESAYDRYKDSLYD